MEPLTGEGDGLAAMEMARSAFAWMTVVAVAMLSARLNSATPPVTWAVKIWGLGPPAVAMRVTTAELLTSRIPRAHVTTPESFEQPPAPVAETKVMPGG